VPSTNVDGISTRFPLPVLCAVRALLMIFFHSSFDQSIAGVMFDIYVMLV